MPRKPSYELEIRPRLLWALRSVSRHGRGNKLRAGGFRGDAFVEDGYVGEYGKTRFLSYGGDELCRRSLRMRAVRGVEGDDIRAGVRNRPRMLDTRSNIYVITGDIDLPEADDRQLRDVPDGGYVGRGVGADGCGAPLFGGNCELRHDIAAEQRLAGEGLAGHNQAAMQEAGNRIGRKSRLRHDESLRVVWDNVKVTAMKLKLDLHPIYNDTGAIERSLHTIIDEAIEKRADEIEIIPGKGSGALKKSVLRFLDRPDIKAKYHRLHKDSDNWGRLFVYFRHAPVSSRAPAATPMLHAEAPCFCCGAAIAISMDPDVFESGAVCVYIVECASCGSPNKVSVRKLRQDRLSARAESGYE